MRAARKQFEVADYRYRAGLVTFLDVATAENSALEIERTAVQLRGQQLVASVSLVRSLGGGWQDPVAPSSPRRIGNRSKALPLQGARLTM